MNLSELVGDSVLAGLIGALHSHIQVITSCVITTATYDIVTCI